MKKKLNYGVTVNLTKDEYLTLKEMSMFYHCSMSNIIRNIILTSIDEKAYETWLEDTCLDLYEF